MHEPQPLPLDVGDAEIEYNRLRDRLSVDWLSDDLACVRSGLWQFRLGWFGELEGSGHFELERRLDVGGGFACEKIDLGTRSPREAALYLGLLCRRQAQFCNA
jgi:hypothetical protein